jgi:hypothetical protein
MLINCSGVWGDAATVYPFLFMPYSGVMIVSNNPIRALDTRYSDQVAPVGNQINTGMIFSRHDRQDHAP